MYLNKRNLSFDPKKGIPSDVIVWVNLPHLPLHYWSDEVLTSIGNSLGHYIDKYEPKSPMFSSVGMWMEFM